jgi:hypothetical protein
MAMSLSIHQRVYDTRDMPEDEALAIIGGGSIKPRRERLNAFLAGNKWDLAAFIAWLPEWNLALPGKITMAKNAVIAGKEAVASGFKAVSEEEQEARKAICREPCEFFITNDDPNKERCSRCGCFTTYKAKLEAWHCPVDKW